MVFTISFISGPVAQLVASLIADPGVVSSIPAWLHTFMKIDHSHPSADPKRADVSYMYTQKTYSHGILILMVNHYSSMNESLHHLSAFYMCK